MRGRPAAKTELEMSVRFKRKQTVLSEWIFRENRDVEVINYFPSGQIAEHASVTLSELRAELKNRLPGDET